MALTEQLTTFQTGQGSIVEIIPLTASDFVFPDRIAITASAASAIARKIKRRGERLRLEFEDSKMKWEGGWLSMSTMYEVAAKYGAAAELLCGFSTRARSEFSKGEERYKGDITDDDDSTYDDSLSSLSGYLSNASSNAHNNTSVRPTNASYRSRV